MKQLLVILVGITAFGGYASADPISDVAALPGIGGCQLSAGNASTFCSYYLSNGANRFHTDANGKSDNQGTGCADQGVVGHPEIKTIVDYANFAIKTGFCVSAVHANNQIGATTVAATGAANITGGHTGGGIPLPPVTPTPVKDPTPSWGGHDIQVATPAPTLKIKVITTPTPAPTPDLFAQALALPGIGSCKLSKGNSGTACGAYLTNQGVGFHTDSNDKPDGKGTGCADNGVAGHSEIITVVDYTKFAIKVGFCVDPTVHINHQADPSIISQANALSGIGLCKLSAGNASTACSYYLTKNGVGFHTDAKGIPDGLGTGCADNGIAGFPQVKSVIDYVNFAIKSGFCAPPVIIKVQSTPIPAPTPDLFAQALGLPGIGSCKLAKGNSGTACGAYLSNQGVGFHTDSNDKPDGKGTGCADNGVAGHSEIKTVVDYVKFAIKVGFCVDPTVHINHQADPSIISQANALSGIGECKLSAGNANTACTYYLTKNGVGFHTDASDKPDGKGTGCADNGVAGHSEVKSVIDYVKFAIKTGFCAPAVIIKRIVTYSTMSDADLVAQAKSPGVGTCVLSAGNVPATDCSWYLKKGNVGFDGTATGGHGTGCATDYNTENNTAFIAKYIRSAIAAGFCPPSFTAP